MVSPNWKLQYKGATLENFQGTATKGNEIKHVIQTILSKCVIAL